MDTSGAFCTWLKIVVRVGADRLNGSKVDDDQSEQDRIPGRGTKCRVRGMKFAENQISVCSPRGNGRLSFGCSSKSTLPTATTLMAHSPEIEAVQMLRGRKP